MRSMRNLLLLIVVGMLATLAVAAKNKDLLKAISQNNPALVNMALKSGDNPNLVGEDGDSPLMAAVRGGKYKAAKALVKAKADLSFVDTSGKDSTLGNTKRCRKKSDTGINWCARRASRWRRRARSTRRRWSSGWT